MTVATAHRETAPLTAARPPLLRVEDLRVTFAAPKRQVEAVRGVSFTIAPGEILALVGESGSGKSVTARALVGLAGPNAEVATRAMTLVDHAGRVVDLRRLSPSAWLRVRGREIGFILQDALVSLDPLRTIGREVAEPLLTHALLPHPEIGAEVQALLTRVGIPDPELRATQYAHELSGGLRQRALIASAIAARPQLLIADEPTTALDVTVQQQVLAVLSALSRAGHAILLITHDLAVASELAHRVAVMQHGRLVESGPTPQVLTQPRHAYTQGLLAAVPSAATRGRWLSTVGLVPPRVPSAQPPPPLLEIDDVSFSFGLSKGRRLQALAGVSLHVRPGETLGVVGESGSGKTTLGKVALALELPERGEVRFDGGSWSRLTEASRRSSRRFFQTVVQDPLGSFDPRYSVERVLEQPLDLRTGLDRRARQAKILELLELVGLSSDLLARRPQTLSGGQRQRVSIAQALASEPKILICDEPVSSLDVVTQAQILDLLVALQGRLGLAMLFISHDLGVIQHLSHRIAVMEAGKVVETGTVSEVFDDPRHPYTRRLLAAVSRLPTALEPGRDGGKAALETTEIS